MYRTNEKQTKLSTEAQEEKIAKLQIKQTVAVSPPPPPPPHTKGDQFPGKRERDIYYTYPALRLIQVLPGHPLADSKDETVSSSLQRRTSL